MDIEKIKDELLLNPEEKIEDSLLVDILNFYETLTKTSSVELEVINEIGPSTHRLIEIYKEILSGFPSVMFGDYACGYGWENVNRVRAMMDEKRWLMRSLL